VEGHQQVVAHEVEGHRQDRRGDVVEIDIAPLVRATVDLVARDRPVLDDPAAHLGRGHAAVALQAGEGGGHDRGEGRPPVAEAAEQREQVAAESAGIGGLHRVRAPVVVDGREHQVALVRPAAVQHRHAGLGPGGHGLHRQAGEPGVRQLLPGGVEQRVLQLLATAPVSDLIGHDHEPSPLSLKRGLLSL
jgi:hypothetical protein